jgi:peptidoglycan LD-endopeptidase LytH
MPSFRPTRTIASLLEKHADQLQPLLAMDLSAEKVALLDFSRQNPSLGKVHLEDTATFARYVELLLEAQGAEVGIGGYLEHRVIYHRSELFGNSENSRSIHLGIDIWSKAFTPVFAPLPAQVHSFADNIGFGNYGPTLLLEHQLEGIQFYTLYGHLSKDSLQKLYPGMPIRAGECVGETGPYPENGDWPPHLHFQLMTNLEGRSGDFPGVVSEHELAHFKAICPDPNLILRSRHLLEKNKG